MGGLVIFVGGWPELPEDFTDERAAVIWCAEHGHDPYVCPSCGDYSCRRCKAAL